MPDIKINKDELKKQKLFVATPMYGGNCSGLFARSIADLSAVCTHHGISLQLYFLFNESLITRARNYCADSFMESDATHLMWIDADIGFDAKDVLGLLILSLQNPEYDIIGAPYPKKAISWEKVVQAANKGLAEPPLGQPNDLERYVGDFVFNPKAGTSQIKISEPCEVLEIGTGFMMARRDTMIKFKDHYWDGITFMDDRIIRSPFFLPKLQTYYQQVMSQSSDSLMRDIDYKLLLARSNPEMYKFLLNWFTDE